MSTKKGEQQIEALFEAGDQALMTADVAALSQIFAEDYVQYGPSGAPLTREQILNNFRSGNIRYPSIVSTGRKIRLFGNTAVVHGSESDEVESAGRRFTERYIFLEGLLKRNGEGKN